MYNATSSYKKRNSLNSSGGVVILLMLPYMHMTMNTILCSYLYTCCSQYSTNVQVFIRIKVSHIKIKAFFNVISNLNFSFKHFIVFKSEIFVSQIQINRSQVVHFNYLVCSVHIKTENLFTNTLTCSCTYMYVQCLQYDKRTHLQ